MKNNIILILVVTVISVAVIIISVMVSLGGNSDESSSSRSSGETSETTSRTEPAADTSVPVVVTSEIEPPQNEPSAEQEDSSEAMEPAAEDIIALARSLIGTDFADGGETPASGFDNSGFIYYVLRENGYITCPRGVSAQSQMGVSKKYGELAPGDLVFFSEGDSAEFGGIYTGNGVMIACLMPGTQVREVDITTSYYSSHFFCGVGII